MLNFVVITRPKGKNKFYVKFIFYENGKEYAFERTRKTQRKCFESLLKSNHLYENFRKEIQKVFEKTKRSCYV